MNDTFYKVMAVIVTFVLGMTVGVALQYAVWDSSDNCVPGTAIAYSGGAWWDRDGRAVMVTPEEDSFPFCTKEAP